MFFFILRNRLQRLLQAGLLMCLFSAALARAQEAPYFVTYDHHLEEPGNLEIETSATAGVPRSGQQPAGELKTAFGRSNASMGSTRCCIWNMRT